MGVHHCLFANLTAQGVNNQELDVLVLDQARLFAQDFKNIPCFPELIFTNFYEQIYTFTS